MTAEIRISIERPIGSTTAAKFLTESVGKNTRGRRDITKTFLSSEESDYVVKGRIGVPTRTLVKQALDLAKDDE